MDDQGNAVAVGDQVMVVQQTWRKSEVGTVAKIGHKLVHVLCRGKTDTYRRDTQAQANTVYSGHFYTMTQWAERERESVARQTLREHGVNLEWSSKWTTDQLVKLAAYVAELRAQ